MRIKGLTKAALITKIRLDCPWEEPFMKHLILITSPPASGKTFIAKKLAEALGECVYLDKDSVIVLSRRIFEVAGEPFDRSSDFFERNVRDYEYEAIMAIALEALDYSSHVLVNAPFNRELRDEEYLRRLRETLAGKGAKLTVVWVHTDIEVCHQRMIARGSERDTWKLRNWEEYVASRSFEPPALEGLRIIDNSTDNSYRAGLQTLLEELE